MTNPYPPDSPTGYDEDDGTMPNNVAELADNVVGHRIVSAERAEFPSEGTKWSWGEKEGFRITLDDGRAVWLRDTQDCCAFTYLDAFLLHPERVDHIITGVAPTEGYTRWHIYANLGDVLELTVGWSCGNPFFYGYGFDIDVVQP